MPWQAARSIANHLQLLDQGTNPGYPMVFSQAQQLAWVEQYYPDLFARLQRAVEAGHVDIVRRFALRLLCRGS